MEATNFGMGKDEKELLFHEGQQAARRFYGITESHLGIFVMCYYINYIIYIF